jgi:hypothetical protein
MAINQSQRDKIVSAAFAALNNSANTPPCKTFRSRTDAATEPELPLIMLFVSSEEVQRVDLSTVERMLTLRIEPFTSGAPPQDQALDPLLEYAVTTLMTDATFLSLIQDVVDAKYVWELNAGDEDSAMASLDFKVTYLTARSDPSLAKAGYTGVVYASADQGATWNDLAELADVGFELSLGTVEVTNNESAGEEYGPTIPAWTATARQLYVKSDAAQSALLAACLGGQMLQFRFDPAGTAAGNDRLSGFGLMQGVKFGQQPTPSQPMWQNLSIRGSGPLVRTAQ